MDGTLIDLNFDNVLWNEELPREYAALHGLDQDSARQLLFDHMEQQTGTIGYYCLDTWADFTGLDIMALHRAGVDRVVYREGSVAFLTWLAAQPQQVVLATNAHRKSLEFKDAQLGLVQHFDQVVSSHDYQQVKERPEFWQTMQRSIGFDPQRTLFIDDHEGVLQSAQAHGIAHLLCVSRPNSMSDPKTTSQFPLIDDLSSLIE